MQQQQSSCCCASSPTTSNQYSALVLIYLLYSTASTVPSSLFLFLTCEEHDEEAQPYARGQSSVLLHHGRRQPSDVTGKQTMSQQ